MKDIYEELDKLDVQIHDFHNPVIDIITIGAGGKYDIFYNPAYSRTTAELKMKLAHEYGHCKTGRTHTFTTPFELISKNEYLADKCSFETFLPWEEILDGVAAGCKEYWELAEWLEMDERFVRRAMKYYTENRGYTIEKGRAN